MDDRGRGKALWHRSFRRGVVLLAAWAGVSGCAGPKAVRYTRIRYNEVIRDTNDEQLLLNIVRLRYADSPVFIDLPNITSQFEVAGRGNYFYIASDDVNSRAVLAILEILFALQESDSRHVGPLLTLPLGG